MYLPTPLLLLATTLPLALARTRNVWCKDGNLNVRSDACTNAHGRAIPGSAHDNCCIYDEWVIQYYTYCRDYSVGQVARGQEDTAGCTR